METQPQVHRVLSVLLPVRGLHTRRQDAEDWPLQWVCWLQLAEREHVAAPLPTGAGIGGSARRFLPHTVELFFLSSYAEGQGFRGET